jgi:HAD superfamily phosphatase (TIGR01668 family)
MIEWLLTMLILSGIVLLIVNSAIFVASAKPWLRVPNITHISIPHLKSVGVKGIIFDVDFTLTTYHGNELHPLIADAFDKLAMEFRVTVFTNTTSEERHREVQRMMAGIPIVNHQHRKPGESGFLEAARILSLHPKEMVMVGDRFTTDIFGGNRAGMKTILVTEPLGNGNPPWHPVLRWFEYTIFG